jgi:hypothetical protein
MGIVDSFAGDKAAGTWNLPLASIYFNVSFLGTGILLFPSFLVLTCEVEEASLVNQETRAERIVTGSGNSPIQLHVGWGADLSSRPPLVTERRLPYRPHVGGRASDGRRRLEQMLHCFRAPSLISLEPPCCQIWGLVLFHSLSAGLTFRHSSLVICKEVKNISCIVSAFSGCDIT